MRAIGAWVTVLAALWLVWRVGTLLPWPPLIVIMLCGVALLACRLHYWATSAYFDHFDRS
jgi:uncharacterized protein YqgC (DUF456 family)